MRATARTAAGRSGRTDRSGPGARRTLATVGLALTLGSSVICCPPIAAAAEAPGPGPSATQVVSDVPGAAPAVLDGRVLALTQVGTLIVAGGTFDTAASTGGSPEARHNVLAFEQGTGTLTSTFAPRVGGTVYAVAPGIQPGTVLVAGSFTRIDGRPVGRVALLDATTGAPVPGFRAPAINGAVRSLAVSHGRLLIGGTFTLVDGQRRGGLASLDAGSGDLTAFLQVRLAGRHNRSGSGARGRVGAKALDVTPEGDRLVVVGNFDRADGRGRPQIAMVGTGGAAARVVRRWATAGYAAPCTVRNFDSDMRDVSFSPDGRWFVVTATGGYNPGTLCDAAARFETWATGRRLAPTWVDHTGGDTLWGVEATDAAVYVGGHMRWMNNGSGRNRPGPGAVPRPGIAALAPRTGLPLAWNPGRHPRGGAAYDLLVTDEGLLVGSDTKFIGYFHYRRPRLAYFPFAGGRPPASSAAARVPAGAFVGRAADGATGRAALTGRLYDGRRFGRQVEVDPRGVHWRRVRGAFLVGGNLYYGLRNGHLYRRPDDCGALGSPVAVDPYHDPHWAGLPTGSGSSTYTGRSPALFKHLGEVAGFAYRSGRLYFTLRGQPRLYWSWFEPDSGIVGDTAFTAAKGSTWRDARLGFFVGRRLLFASGSTGRLQQVRFHSARPAGRAHAAGRGRSWAGRALFLAPPGPALSGGSGTSGATCP